MNRRIVVAVAVAVTILIGGCSIAGNDTKARTYYESLDLSSPEATVETFTNAFAKDDFMTVWLSFDYRAQSEIRNAFNLIEFSKLMDISQFPDPGNTIADTMSGLFQQGNVDMWRAFDEIMLLADENDALLIDITELESLELDNAAASGEASVVVEMKGSDEDLLINLTQAEDDRWFVRQVVAPEGDPDSIPWAVPARDE